MIGVDWDRAAAQIQSGQPICLYDFPDREDETDVVYIGQKVTPAQVDFIRRVVGGPLAVYLLGGFLQRLGICTFVELVRSQRPSGALGGLVDHDRDHDPCFAISVDARDNRTGCSPLESAYTVNVLYELVVGSDGMSQEDLVREFAKRLVSPGHVPIVRAADTLLLGRRGHAELALTLAQMLGVPEIVVAGELTDPVAFTSMKPDVARGFAQEWGLPLLSGDDILRRASGYSAHK